MLDIYDDANGAILKHILNEYEIPAGNYSKCASEKMIYAAEREQKFPLDEPEDIIMSYLYLKKNASNMDPMYYSVVENNIKQRAELLGIDLNFRKKVAHIPLSPEQFALALPFSKIASIEQEYFEKFRYNDYLLMYPLDTPENIKLASFFFPKGLDYSLEVYRPLVARKIASLVEPNELGENVKQYLPISKSAALDQLKLREEEFPEFAPYYRQLENYLIDPEENYIKFANDLAVIDQYAGISYYPRFMHPSKFAHLGIVNDSTVSNDPETEYYAHFYEKLASNFDRVSGFFSRPDLINYGPEHVFSEFIQLPEPIQQKVASLINGSL